MPHSILLSHQCHSESIFNSIAKKREEKEISNRDFVFLHLPFINECTTNVVKRELRKLNLNYAICPIFYTEQHLSNNINSEQSSLNI